MPSGYNERLVTKHLLIGAAVSAIAAAQAAAQTTPSDEIVVTAQRQEQSLQDVPISVTALGGEDLEARQIEGFTDIQFNTPNLNFTKSQFTNSVLTIRGITNLAVASTSSASVSIHQNDIPQTMSRLFETEFFDINRIEILRGPQGTLFGRNATGGVLNVHTNKASTDEFGGYIDAEYGNFQAFETRGAVNIPLGETLAARVAGTYISRDGYTENLFTGNSIDDRNIFAVRGSLRWLPTENTTIDAAVSYFEEDDNRSSFQTTRCNADPILGCATGLIGAPGGPSSLGFDQPALSGTISSIASTGSLAALGGLFGEQIGASLEAGGAPAGTAAALQAALANAYGAAGLFPTGVDLNALQGLGQPTDLRQVNLDFDPQYFADEFFLSFNAKHDFENFSVKLNGGFGSTSVDSIRDTDGGVLATVAIPDFASIPSIPAVLAGAGVPGVPAPVATQLGLASFFANGLPTSGLSEGGVISGDIQNFGNRIFGVEQSVQDAEYYSVEGILSTNFEGPLNFLAGVNYLRNDSQSGADFNVSSNALDYFSVVAGTLVAQTLVATGQLGDPVVDSASVIGTVPVSFYTPTFNNDSVDSQLRSVSVFGEVYWDITDTLQFTGGIRYNNDRISTFDRNAFIASFTEGVLGGAAIPPVLAIGTTQEALLTLLDPEPLQEGTPGAASDFLLSELTFGAVTGRAVLNWEATPNQNYYVSYSRGFKPGGINPPTGNALAFDANFDRETVNAFEVGAKLVGLDNRLRANMSAFYYDYGGYQLPTLIGLTTVNSNVDARIFGLEGEFLYAATDKLRFNLTASYLNTEIQDFQSVDPANPAGFRDGVDVFRDIISGTACVVDNNGLPSLVGQAVPGLGTLTPFVPLCSTLSDVVAGANAMLPAGAPQYEFALSGLPVDLDGNELPQSPNYSVAVGAEYDIYFGERFVFTPRLDYFYQGEFFASQFNRVADRVEGYGNLNLQGTFRPTDGRWYARIFAQNVFDSDNVQGQLVGSQGQGAFINQFIQEPRRYGGAIGFEF